MIWARSRGEICGSLSFIFEGEIYEPHEIRVPVLEKEWWDNLGNWRFRGSGVDSHRNG